jgi:hypothetical protein
VKNIKINLGNVALFVQSWSELLLPNQNLFVGSDEDVNYYTAPSYRAVQMTAAPQKIYFTGISNGERQADSNETLYHRILLSE